MTSNAKRNPFDVAMEKQKPEPPPEKVHNAGARPARQGLVGLTVYIDPVAHKALKLVSLKTDTSLNDLLRDGINYVLQLNGEDVIA